MKNDLAAGTDRLSAGDATRTRWWWVRHAPVRSDGGRIYGQRDLSCDCSERDVFQSVACLLPRGAVWLTSPLKRTTETAAALRAEMGEAEASEPLALAALAEQSFGAWQGQDRAAFFASRPTDPSSYWLAPADERAPEGESFLDLMDRLRPAVAEITERHAGRDIVAVAHGGTIRAALALALDLPPRTALAFGVDNVSLTRLDHLSVDGRAGWRALMVNHQPWEAVGGGMALGATSATA